VLPWRVTWQWQNRMSYPNAHQILAVDPIPQFFVTKDTARDEMTYLLDHLQYLEFHGSSRQIVGTFPIATDDWSSSAHTSGEKKRVTAFILHHGMLTLTSDKLMLPRRSPPASSTATDDTLEWYILLRASMTGASL
jgi:hypothetical protein